MPSRGSLRVSYAEDSVVARTATLLSAPQLRLVSGIATPGSFATGLKRVGRRVHVEPLTCVLWPGVSALGLHLLTADATGVVKAWTRVV